VAERAGNLPAALVCVNRAARGLSGNGPPPSDLYQLRTRLQAKLTRPPAAGETFDPPAWSWPPLNVFTPPERPSLAPNDPGTATVSAPAARAATPSPAASPVAAPSALVVSPSAAGSSAGVVGVLVPSAEWVEAKILTDPSGQWAAGAVAGSQYGRTQYSAAKATGAPDVPVVGNSPDAWCPASKDKGTDWLEVTFAKPVHAAEVRARQNDTAGAIAKIEAIEPDGTAHVWWEGVDPYQPSAGREIVWFGIRVPKTSYLVVRVKLTLNLASGPGWKEIDAVQLVGAAE